MKPYVETNETSCPPDSKYGEGDEEQFWSVSVTNLPNDVFDDENTKVNRYCALLPVSCLVFARALLFQAV